MTVLITLTVAGADTGPSFDLYSDVNGYTPAFETGVSKSALLAGYSSSLVPDFTTIIRVLSVGEDCTNYIDIPLTSTTTTTSTAVPTTTTTTSTAVPTTTTTTTAVSVAGCIRLSKNFVTTSQDCLGLPYAFISGTITLELVDNLGAPVIATNDIIVTLGFETRACLDPAPIPINIPVAIVTGTSSTNYSYTRERVYDCGQGACETEYDIFQSVVSVSPVQYSLCCNEYDLNGPNVSGEENTTTYIDCSGGDGTATAYDYQIVTFCANNIVSGGDEFLIGTCNA